MMYGCKSWFILLAHLQWHLAVVSPFLFVIPYVTIEEPPNVFPWHLIPGISKPKIRENLCKRYIRTTPTHNWRDVCAFLRAFLSKLPKYLMER
jgi:hypothetical protein